MVCVGGKDEENHITEGTGKGKEEYGGLLVSVTGYYVASNTYCGK